MLQEEVNLNKLVETGIVKEFVRSCNGIWSHEAWLDFCNALSSYGLTPIDFAKVGQLLEKEKKLQTSEGKYKIINICCPYCRTEIIKPLNYFEQSNIFCNHCFADIASETLKLKIKEIKKRLK